MPNAKPAQHTDATGRNTLSFDGKGINGPDEYRSRLATFIGNDAAQTYGALFAAAPDLLAALKSAHALIYDKRATSKAEWTANELEALLLADNAIARAEGR